MASLEWLYLHHDEENFEIVTLNALKWLLWGGCAFTTVEENFTVNK